MSRLMESAQVATSMRRLVEGRHSCRAFRSQAVPKEAIRGILDTARFAPSGTNTQPWHVHVVSGTTRSKLIAALEAAFDDPERDVKYKATYDYYPSAWSEPYLGRRRKVGWDLYSLLQISKGDKAAMHAQHRRNMRFFDAPVGMFFTIDRNLGQGSWVDYGMFIQNVMLSAELAGLQTCPQAAFLQFHELIRNELCWPETQTLVCGMSIGYADPSAIENSLLTDRESVESFTQFFE